MERPVGKYIPGIVQNQKHKMLAIGSMPGHIHIFIGYNVNHLIPDLLYQVDDIVKYCLKPGKASYEKNI